MGVCKSFRIKNARIVSIGISSVSVKMAQGRAGDLYFDICSFAAAADNVRLCNLCGLVDNYHEREKI